MQYSDPLATSLAEILRGPPPGLLVVESPPGAAARRRLARLLKPARWLRPLPGGGRAQAEGLLTDLAGYGGHPSDPALQSWAAVWSAWLAATVAAPGTTWVLDARDPLPANAWAELVRIWSGVRGQAIPVRLVVLAEPGSGGRLSDLPHERLLASPVSAWTWAVALTSWPAADRIRAAAIFGSEERFRTLVDPSRSLARNVRTLVLGADAPMGTAALDRVRHSVQRPERYIRVTRAVALGASDWGTIRASVGGLSGSGQLGPYLKGLEEAGVIRSDRSLDAPPRSRSARYRVADPWLAFWYSCVLPSWSRLGTVDPKQLWQGEVKPRLESHVDRVLPQLMAEWLGTPAARERLGSTARETGRLWGDGYDIQVAGTLDTGAIVYGWRRWAERRFTESSIAEATGQLRTTRYGFGRENRIRLFVQRAPVDHDLARLAARDPDMRLFSIDGLLRS